MKSTDKKEKDIFKHKNSNPQIQTNSFQNQSHIDTNLTLSNKIKSAMHSIEQEIILLSKKRSLPFQSINFSTTPYINYIPPKNKIVTNKQDYPYLLQVFQSYVFSNPEQENSLINNKGVKRIGITSKDIFKIPKYKIDINNLPKFGHISDNQIFIETNDYISHTYDRSFYFKRNPTNYSTIEKQNREAKKLLEQRREKYKGLSKENKEQMDNIKFHQYWEDMAKHEVPKFPRIYQKYKNETEAFNKRLSTLIHKELKKKVNKIQRTQKEYCIRAKKLQKEMLIYWKKREKEIVDVQKKKEKLEIDKKRKEDELKEQINQKKRMEYLLKQSDIYSLFMYKHLGAFMPKDENENNENNNSNNNTTKKDEENYKMEIIGGKSVLVNKKTNKILFNSIQVDIDENEARKNVNSLINLQKQKAAEFDKNINVIRKTLGGEEVAIKNTTIENLDEEINNNIDNENDNNMQIERLDKPMINNSSSQLIEVPKSFMGDLKEYQLKGLRWLDNLFEQGINGILADEMGLGKTIQAIAFLAHLSEDKNNWGPFLVIAPNATLYNWQQEFNRFCPSLKVLPYWGALKERKTLRKFFNSTQLYVKNSAFHVCITSYQLIVCDEKVFHKVNWNYMILDEAQAIKNIASQRWNTLLSFNCRNRLLLSGTPIQNSMSELWALLHFIMPNLFDSHEQFQDWFSKDIEAHSQDKGELNQEQLKRLHQILKPFMLRRVKKDVEHEIGPKVEYEILCYMTEKQKVLYNSIKQKLNNISDLFKSTDSKLKVTNLMNLVIQFRKVCNHPELFERNIGKVPFTFKNLIDDLGAGSLFIILNGEQYLRINEYPAINYVIPKMVYDLCYDKYNIKKYITKKMIICDDLNFEEKYVQSYNNKNFNSLFNIFHLFDMSLYQLKQLFVHDEFIMQLSLKYFFEKKRIINNYYKENELKEKICLFISKELFPIEDDYKVFSKKGVLEPLIINTFLSRKKCILHNLIIHRCYIPKVVSFSPLLLCSNRRTMINQRQIKYNLLINKMLYGLNFNQFNKSLNLKISSINREILNNENSHSLLENGLMTPLFYQMEGYTQIELPSFERLISDCAKLKKLDELLKKLIAEDHRVLIFCQMTRMLDILEEYMSKRKYTYFRMDGSTQIADRRDMINEFQTNPKIFAFLLSTRAGGLGVNLTGADTVIFYDNDWNPTMDAQATDRAHRIGQTKVVSVYRLITADTIEERVLKRAKQKQNVQATVYSGGAFKADIFKQNDIVELLYSEEEMKKMEQDKKKLLLELNNNETIRNDGDINIFGNINGTNSKNINGDLNINGGNQLIGKNHNKENNKGLKKKRGPKKEKKISNENKRKEGFGSGDNSSQVNMNKGKRTKKNSIMGNGLSRNIFSVRNNNINGTGNDKNKKNNVVEEVVEIV